MEVTGATQIGMFDDRVLGIARTAFELVGDDGGDALVGQCADRDRAGRDQLGAFGINILEQPKHAETGPESLFGMRPIGQDGEDEPLGVGPDRPPPARGRLPRSREPERRRSAWEAVRGYRSGQNARRLSLLAYPGGFVDVPEGCRRRNGTPSSRSCD